MHCLEKDEVGKVLSELHVEEASGHFDGDTTAHKVIRVGYYCVRIFRHLGVS
jgi:hypothetical protein